MKDWIFSEKMREKLGFLVGACFLLCGFCCGRFVVSEFLNMEELQFVVYPKANQKACKGFDEVGNISFKSRPGGLPTLLIFHTSLLLRY